ncbi:MAG: glycosyltransferase [Bacteroidota bacterium]
MKRTYCTLFDKNYLPHVLTLIDSLKMHVNDFVIYCFCMDEESFDRLQKNKMPETVPISIKELERFYPELYNVKQNRSKVEYYFTSTASICSYVFSNYKGIDILTYLDADLYFFSSPQPLYNELKDASVGIIEHKFYGLGKRFEKYGRFNVGLVAFINNENGRACLEDWRTDCIKWCYDYLDGDKFADQKYLDKWPEKYKGVHIIEHIGANVAPWNVGSYKINVDTQSNNVMINNRPLIFYHFASLKQVTTNSYLTNISRYLAFLSTTIRNDIYIPYIKKLRNNQAILGATFAVRDRKEYLWSGIGQHIRDISRNLRKFIYKDKIIIKL